MEIGTTNEAYLSSVTVDEKAHETPGSSERGLPTDTHTMPRNENASVAKCLLKWRKYLVLFLTPILLMPLPIVVPTTVRLLMLCLFYCPKSKLKNYA